MVGTDRPFEERQAPLEQRPRLLTIRPVRVEPREVEDENAPDRCRGGSLSVRRRPGPRPPARSPARGSLPRRRAPSRPAAASRATSSRSLGRRRPEAGQPKRGRARRDWPAPRRDGEDKGPAAVGRHDDLSATLTAEEVARPGDGVAVSVRWPSGPRRSRVTSISTSAVCPASSLRSKVCDSPARDRSIDRRTGDENRRLEWSR